MLKGLVENSPKTEGGPGPVRMGAEVSEKLQGKKSLHVKWCQKPAKVRADKFLELSN